MLTPTDYYGGVCRPGTDHMISGVLSVFREQTIITTETYYRLLIVVSWQQEQQEKATAYCVDGEQATVQPRHLVSDEHLTNQVTGSPTGGDHGPIEAATDTDALFANMCKKDSKDFIAC
jgi:hypothetical protein